MKSKVLQFVLVMACLTLLVAGCAKQAEKHYCVKCGVEATSTISGPAETMESYGISLSACREVVSNVYSAYICDSCTGPVVELEQEFLDSLE